MKTIAEYKFAISVIILFLLAMLLFFGPNYFYGVARKFADVNWWIDNTISLLIFGFFVSFLVSRFQEFRESKVREPFEGYQLKLTGLKDQPKPQPIFWQDMQRNEFSTFEKWKFIKSALSSTCWINTPNIEEAQNRWLSFQNKSIIVDFAKMSDKDVGLKKLQPLLAQSA